MYTNQIIQMDLAATYLSNVYTSIHNIYIYIYIYVYIYKLSMSVVILAWTCLEW